MHKINRKYSVYTDILQTASGSKIDILEQGNYGS